jgi:hypothetical protein
MDKVLAEAAAERDRDLALLKQAELEEELELSRLRELELAKLRELEIQRQKEEHQNR